MPNRFPLAGLLGAVVLASVATTAAAQTTVNYGRITNVTLITEQNRAAQTGGAVLGGALGAASARNRSGGTAALRAGAGVLGGQAIGRVATQRQAFEYTILIDGRQTVTMVTDEAGLRVGDCVAVERGSFNNLRLVDDSRCNPRPAAQGQKAAPPKATAADVRQADACIQAKDRLLDAETEDDFERAYRRVRLLCSD
jgi:outer membrane lipoprotein SlyB